MPSRTYGPWASFNIDIDFIYQKCQCNGTRTSKKRIEKLYNSQKYAWKRVVRNQLTVNILITAGLYLRGFAFLVQSAGTKFRAIAIPLIHKDR